SLTEPLEPGSQIVLYALHQRPRHCNAFKPHDGQGKSLSLILRYHICGVRVKRKVSEQDMAAFMEEVEQGFRVGYGGATDCFGVRRRQSHNIGVIRTPTLVLGRGTPYYCPPARLVLPNNVRIVHGP